ncbi:MAG: PKD domain-containing protein [Thermoplasmatota archaeon]
MFTGTFISWVSCEIQGENSPPEKPSKPIGSTAGKIDETYTYTTSASDPNANDMIYYLFDWGDGTNSSWIGPYATGDTCNTLHQWTSKGSYNVKVQAKDYDVSLSEWSDPLVISMPKIHSYDQTMQLFFKKVERFTFI